MKNQIKKLNIEILEGKQTLKSLTEKLNEIIVTINNMPAPRDRGPKSTREMTESDARELMLGKYKDFSHKKAAEVLGLSYGQVYSARNGYTFKAIYDEMIKNSK